jgi:hypothetical protein
MSLIALDQHWAVAKIDGRIVGSVCFVLGDRSLDDIAHFRQALVKNTRGRPASADAARFHGCYGQDRRMQMAPQLLRERLKTRT